MKCKLITNNSYLTDPENTKQYRIAEIDFVDTIEIMDIFLKTRDYIHQGYKLLTHPLSGSVKPFETPFKSIAISDKPGELDMESLMIIEDAIQMAKKFKRDESKKNRFTDRILDDFRMIDFGLISSGLESLNNF